MVQSLLRVAIPLPWVVFIVLQSSAGIFWLSKLDSRIYSIEENGTVRIAKLEAKIEDMQRFVH